MNELKTWKKSYVDETEIDLIDAMLYLLRYWIPIIACALALAMVLGVVGVIRTAISNREKTPISRTDVLESVEDKLTKDELFTLESAENLYDEIQRLDEYMENSILMQIDATHKKNTLLLFSIDGAGSKSNQEKILYSYLNYISNGQLTASLAFDSLSGWDSEDVYIRELIGAWDASQRSSTVSVQDTVTNSNDVSLFYVSLTAQDAEHLTQLTTAVKDTINAYTAMIVSQTAQHTLNLISEQTSTVYDGGLVSTINGNKTTLLNNEKSLESSVKAFSGNQKLVYEAGVTEKETAKGTLEEKTAIAKFKAVVKAGIKFGVLGFLVGGFLSCAWLGCLYLFNGKIKTKGELEDTYTIPQLGFISIPQNINALKPEQKEKKTAALTLSKNQIVQGIGMMCKEQNIDNLVISANFTMSDAEKKEFEQVICSLKQGSVRVTFVENLIDTPDAWKSVAETRNVIMLVKLYSTKYHSLDAELALYAQHDLNLVGMVVVDKD